MVSPKIAWSTMISVSVMPIWSVQNSVMTGIGKSALRSAACATSQPGVDEGTRVRRRPGRGRPRQALEVEPRAGRGPTRAATRSRTCWSRSSRLDRALLDDPGHHAVQAPAVLGRQVLGRQDDDRDGPPRLALAQHLEELEAVHLRHHQVEQDEPGRRRRQPLQRDPAVLGLVDGPPGALQHAAHQLAGRRVVLDEEDAAGRRVAPVLGQHRRQPGPVDRLGEIVGRPERVPRVAVVHDGHHDDRDLREVGIGLQRAQHRPAIHPRHDDVERDGVRPQRPGQPHAFLAARGRHHAVPLLAQERGHQVPRGGVVVDHEDGGGVGIDRRGDALGDGPRAARPGRASPSRNRPARPAAGW